MFSGFSVGHRSALLRFDDIGFVQFYQRFQRRGGFYQSFQISQKLVTHIESRNMAYMDMPGSVIQRYQVQSIFDQDDPGLFRLMRMGRNLLRIITETATTGLAFVHLLTLGLPLLDDGCGVFTKWAAFRSGIFKLLIENKIP